MLQAIFHAWERRLASVTKDRVVRPFDWGVEWIPGNGHSSQAPPHDQLRDWVSSVMADTDAFFTPAPTADYAMRSASDGDVLSFPSALATPHEKNNTVYCRYFPARLQPRPSAALRPTLSSSKGRAPGVQKRSASAVHMEREASAARRAAVLVLPQWNSDP